MKQFPSLSKNTQDIVRVDTIYRFSAPFLRILLTNEKKYVKYGLVAHILQICYIYLDCMKLLLIFCFAASSCRIL